MELTYTHYYVYNTCNQQGPTALTKELYSMSCNNLYWMWKAQGAQLSVLWWPRGVGWGVRGRLKKEGIYVYIVYIHTYNICTWTHMYIHEYVCMNMYIHTIYVHVQYEYMYTYSRFILLYSRNQCNIVKQLYSNTPTKNN